MYRFCLYRLLFVVLILNCSGIIKAQTTKPQLVWQKSLGGTRMEWSSRMVPTNDGGFIVVSSTSSIDGDMSCSSLYFANNLWVVKFNKAGQIQWNKCYGITDFQYNQRPAIANTPDGGYIVVGNLPKDNGLTSHGHVDAYVMKLNGNGEIEWHKNYGGSNYDAFTSVQVTNDGYIFMGESRSVDGDVTGPHGWLDIWIVKTDKTGVIQWQKCYGGDNDDVTGSFGGTIKATRDGGFIFTAETLSNNGDIPSTNHNPGVRDLWVVKLSSTGIIQWQKCIGGTNGEDNGGIVQTSDGGYSLTFTSSSADGDLVGLSGNLLLYKLDPNGNILWKKGYGGSGNEQGYDISITQDQGLLLVGTSSSLDAGINSHLTSYGTASEDGFIVKTNSAGDLEWQSRGFGGSSFDYFLNGFIDNEGYVVAMGYTATPNNGDVAGGYNNVPMPGTQFPTDIWLVKLGPGNNIKGQVFVDRNRNGIKDNNEQNYKRALVTTTRNGASTGRIYFDGSFVIAVDTGTYQTTLDNINEPYFTIVPSTKQSVFNSFNLTDSFDFALQPIPGKKDYQVIMLAPTAARPGFNANYVINVDNRGTDTLTSREVRLILNSTLTYQSANPAPSSISGDTLKWMVTNIQPWQSKSINLTIKLAAPPTLNAGDYITMTAFIDSAADVNTSNNNYIFRQMLVGSLDPNDKTDNGAGIMYKNEYDNGEGIVYTIRFQNTGTDTAFNVIVRDTLQNKLNASTIEVLGVSHPYNFEMNNGKTFAWKFNNIKLPDSNRNEPASHGYISYRIKPIAGLSINDVISNSASIYFDFNLPVKTNTQQTTIKPTPVAAPATPIVSGLVNTYCNNLGTQKGKINNLPANGSGITVEVKLDATPLTVAADSSFSFAVNLLSAGAHSITVTFTNAGGSKTTTSNFSISAAATPDVNVSSNITTIINLVDPVTVTASNAAAGGTGPLYTFGKDRTFSNLWQAESATATLNIVPSSLTVGDNWIYVRMKSNASCVTSNIATDSIKLIRDVTTGITDPDNPGKVISLYPNPFNNHIYIKGLSSAKTYKLVLTNISGQLIQQKRISNRTESEMYLQVSKPGSYMLSIYDEKTNKLIGTIKLIKN